MANSPRPFEKGLSMVLFFLVFSFFWKQSLTSTIEDLETHAKRIQEARDVLTAEDMTRSNAPYNLDKPRFSILAVALRSIIVIALFVLLYNGLWIFGFSPAMVMAAQFPNTSISTGFDVPYENFTISYGTKKEAEDMSIMYVNHFWLYSFYGLFLLMATGLCVLCTWIYVTYMVPKEDFYDMDRLKSHVNVIYTASFLLFFVAYAYLISLGADVQDIIGLLSKGNQ